MDSKMLLKRLSAHHPCSFILDNFVKVVDEMPIFYNLIASTDLTLDLISDPDMLNF